MLAQIALIVFAFLAVMSLVVDLGFARITQVQMQNAADTAALEGLRLRNAAADPAASDLQRRTAANRIVDWTFDDDFDTTNGDPDYQFGAGPIIDLTGGAGDFHAHQTMSVPDPHVYKPDLQINQQNEVHGDQVSGRFCYSADPVASEGLVYAQPGTVVCNSPQSGTGSYARNDFNPGVDNSAFLVRLRRSNEFQDLPGQTEPDVASSGPSLPLIFGKGTLIRADDPQFAYTVRRDGFTVRATAIAQVRPALRVGLPQTDPASPRPGVTPFALADTFVQTLNPAANPTGCPVTINPNGTITTSAGGPATCPVAGTGVGRFVDNLSDPTRSRWMLISTVGQAPPAPVAFAAASCAAANFASQYGPVYAAMTSGMTRIIGFTRISLVAGGGADPCAKRISRGASLVAPANATASLMGGLPLPAGAQSAEVTELLDRNLGRNGAVNYGPVLVPVLAR